MPSLPIAVSVEAVVGALFAIFLAYFYCHLFRHTARAIQVIAINLYCRRRPDYVIFRPIATKQLPQRLKLAIPPELIERGKAIVSIKRHAGANCVLGELWVVAE